jgi:cell fate regulator YaaT (PSP1 superfamily)
MSKNSKLVEVAFKGETRAIYRNRNEIEIMEGDVVIVEAERGLDSGRVSLVGELVRLKRGKGETRSLIRKADDRDREIMENNRTREKEAFTVCHDKIAHYRLDMKLVDVEYQHDGSKITFYFTASQRVDFRELVRELAAMYRTRIELRQIGVRDEARRICGYGICGRIQCCCSFLTEFEQISTQMAKDQQLSLNPTKISGNCGRLLCCLRYEEPLYHEVFAKFPQPGSPVIVKGKKGMLTYINVFDETAKVRFEDHTEEWLPPSEISKGKGEPAALPGKAPGDSAGCGECPRKAEHGGE